MAITRAIIQMRRGRESEMVTSKFLPAEFGIAIDTKKAYVAFAAGDVKRLSTYEDMSADMAASLADLEKEYLGQITEATQKALEVREKVLSTIAVAVEAAQNANAAAQTIFEIYSIREITIPTDGWGWEPETGMAYYDVNQSDITEDMMPIISIWTTSMDTAKKCGISTAACTFTGRLRVYAEKAPPEELYANLLLLKTSGGAAGGGGGGNYVLPVATETRLGGVKIGEHVEVTSDGTITVDEKSILSDVIATDMESKEMIDNVFGASISQM